MKRHFIVVAIIACVCALALAGCGSGSLSGEASGSNPSSGEASGSGSSDQSSLAGFWVLEGSDQLGFKAALNLDAEDKFAEFMISNDYLDGTWEADGNTAVISFGVYTDEMMDGLEDEEQSAEVVEGQQSTEAAVEQSAEAAVEQSDEAVAEDDSVTKVTATLVDGKLVLGSDGGSKLVFSKGDMDKFFNELYGAEMEEYDEEDLDIVTDEDGNQVIMNAQEGNDADFEAVEEQIEDIKPISVVDNDQVTIMATGKGTDFTGAYGFRFTVKNNSKKTIYAEVVDSDVRLGDKRVDGVMGADGITPGDTAEAFFSIEDDSVKSVDELKNIQGRIRIGDDKTGEEIATYEFKIE